MILINKEEIEITLCHKHNTNGNLIFLLMINGRPSDLHKVDKTLFDFSSLIKYIFLSKGKSFLPQKVQNIGKKVFSPECGQISPPFVDRLFSSWCNTSNSSQDCQIQQNNMDKFTARTF